MLLLTEFYVYYLQKPDLIRETQIGEFEAAIQPRIEEEKPKQEKRKGKQPLIEKEKPKEKKRVKRSKL